MESSFTDAEKVCTQRLHQPLYPSPPADAHPPCHQRFVLAEMIKVSHMDVGMLVDFAKRHDIHPDWMQMQLPGGTSYTQRASSRRAS